MRKDNTITICLSEKTMLFLARLAYKSTRYFDYDTFNEIKAEIVSGMYSED